MGAITARLGGRTSALLLIGVALMAGAGVALFASTSGPAIAAYESAPTCAGIAEAQAGKECRYTTVAIIAGSTYSPDVTYVNLQLPGIRTLPHRGDAGRQRRQQ